MPEMDNSGGLEEYRQRIDEIDEQLVALLNERTQHALAIGALKIAQGRPIFDTAREGAILRKVHELNQGPMSNRDLGAVFLHLMDISRAMQHQLQRDQVEATVRISQSQYASEAPSR